MLDKPIQSILKPVFHNIAKVAVRQGISANKISITGVLVGFLATFFIVKNDYVVAVILILLSRFLDGLDGAVARATSATDLGGFLDISLDFLFYASIPLAFAFANPQPNALPAATLLATFIGTGSTFLAFAVIAEKRGMQSTKLPGKSFYFLGGLTEATETIAVFVAMCLWPTHFVWLAYGFAALCCITILMRLYWGYQTFRE